MSQTTLPSIRKFSSTEPSGPEVESIFHALVEKWFAEAGMLSNPSKKFTHAAYQQIIGLGPRVVPFLLEDLAQGRGNWIWALSAITREDPVHDEEAGDLTKIAARWLAWGKSKGYLN